MAESFDNRRVCTLAVWCVPGDKSTKPLIATTASIGRSVTVVSLNMDTKWIQFMCSFEKAAKGSAKLSYRVRWFNHHRLLEPIGNMPPAEAEVNYHRPFAASAMSA